jgi:hypothetical protein
MKYAGAGGDVPSEGSDQAMDRNWYRFDIAHAGILHSDSTGLRLGDGQPVRDAALSALLEFALDTPGGPDHYVVSVRSADGNIALTATLQVSAAGQGNTQP